MYIACVPISIAVMCPSYAVALFVSVTTILLLISLNTACAEIEGNMEARASTGAFSVQVQFVRVRDVWVE